MKKILLISTFYYPSSASGVHRIAANAKYFREFGWQPFVLTKLFSKKHHYGSYDPGLLHHPDPCLVWRVDYLSSRTLSRIEAFIWRNFGAGGADNRCPTLLYLKMLRRAKRIVKDNHIDAIWATARGYVAHRIAHDLHGQFGIPWVADFRDLPDQTYKNRSTRLAVKQEIATCGSAAMIVATTDEMTATLKERHRSKVHTIYNGFDSDDYFFLEQQSSGGEYFTINHFGTIYEFRNPSPLFEALDCLIQKDKAFERIQINFYGADARLVSQYAQPFKCSFQIKTMPRLSYHEMIRKQMESHILLVVSPPEQGGAIPAKLYSYMACRRPILVIPGDGAGTDRIVRETRSGITLKAQNDIIDWVEIAFSEWTRTGTVEFKGDMDCINKYSRKEQVRELAVLLDSIVG